MEDSRILSFQGAVLRLSRRLNFSGLSLSLRAIYVSRGSKDLGGAKDGTPGVATRDGVAEDEAVHIGGRAVGSRNYISVWKDGVLFDVLDFFVEEKGVFLTKGINARGEVTGNLIVTGKKSAEVLDIAVFLGQGEIAYVRTAIEG